MGRKRALTDEQVEAILASEKSSKDLAAEFGVSIPTVLKVKFGRGVYARSITDLGVPVLNGHGEVVNVVEG